MTASINAITNYRRRVALPTVLSLYDGVSTHFKQPFLQQSFLMSLTFPTLLRIDALIGFNGGLGAALVDCTIGSAVCFAVDEEIC